MKNMTAPLQSVRSRTISSIPAMCNVLGFKQVETGKSTHIGSSPSLQNAIDCGDSWPVCTSLKHKAENKKKKEKKKRKGGRAIMPCGVFKSWVWIQLHCGFCLADPKGGWVGKAGFPVWSFRSKPAFCLAQECCSQWVCRLPAPQTTALQTDADDWLKHAVGCSMIHPAGGSPCHLPGKRLYQQQLNRMSPGSTPFQCRRSYL